MRKLHQGAEYVVYVVVRASNMLCHRAHNLDDLRRRPYTSARFLTEDKDFVAALSIMQPAKTRLLKCPGVVI